ncbi:MAG: S-sulfosulfanyl-L-cysteine sulfohydrolase [Alphaproteobacteria bacterium]|nr:S-sulfosulfanyl-L-cysteine sulfohydrolase [Alphaproteobacteria bacterium]
MPTRRELLQAGAAAAALIAADGLGGFRRALAQQKLTEADLLNFPRLGNVTLLHVADLHGQLRPIYLREPSANLGFAEARGTPPHLAGREFLRHYDIPAKSSTAHALTSEDFVALTKSYGRIGGLDRLATVVKAVRAERGQDRVLMLDGGNTFHGSLGSYRTQGRDVVDCFKLLKPDGGTAHWEFTYGEARAKEMVEQLGYSLLALNVRDAAENKHVLAPYKTIEKGGVRIAVLGHAYPHTAVVHPRSVLPPWKFGLREDEITRTVERARREGVSLVVLLSQNGFDADRKLASRVEGLDIILTADGDYALPEPLRVGKTLLIASGSHGKFVSRLDLDVRPEGLRDFRYRLIPLFADAIHADPEMADAVEKARAPFAEELSRVLGHTESLLYRRDTFRGTFCDLTCAALLAERDAEIAFSPGLRWGTTVLPDSPITTEDVFNATAISYPQVYRASMTGQRIKDLLEDAADGLCNSDPYQRLGRDMVRSGGLRYRLDPKKALGSRISTLQHNQSGKAIDPAKTYAVAGWGSVADQVEGPPVWEVIESYLGRAKTVRTKPQTSVRVVTG